MSIKSFKIATASFLLVAFITVGCNDFDKINTNPDKPLETTAPWLATSMITDVSSSAIGGGRGFLSHWGLSKYGTYMGQGQEGITYNLLDRVSFSEFNTLRNIHPMLEVVNSLSPELSDSYKALCHFIRAWQFFQLTMMVGDIPFSEGASGNDGFIKPKYDTQKEVFAGILNELEQANTLFANGANFTGDFIYNGNVDKWRRLVNSFELYVLMNLYKKTSDTDLNVVNKFKEVAQRPLMRDFNDNFAVTYRNMSGQAYPWSHTAIQANPLNINTMLGATYINLLLSNQDRRLFYVAEPSAALLAQGKVASDFDAYEGIEMSDSFEATIDQRNKGEFSDLNRHYVDDATAEPVGLLCHWNVEFLLAEAALRGWITNDAQTHFANGIKSSMSFYAHYVDAKYAHGVTMDETYINAYPATVALAGSTEDKIKQIICQQYMAGFLQNRFMAWFEFRRTGYPEFVLNPNSNLNPTDNTKFPTRWMYPQNEINYNRENLEIAVQRQYSGSDDFNGIMWILKD